MNPTFSFTQMLFLIENNESIESLERLIQLAIKQDYTSHEKYIMGIEINEKLDKLIK